MRINKVYVYDMFIRSIFHVDSEGREIEHKERHKVGL